MAAVVSNTPINTNTGSRIPNNVSKSGNSNNSNKKNKNRKMHLAEFIGNMDNMSIIHKEKIYIKRENNKNTENNKSYIPQDVFDKAKTIMSDPELKKKHLEKSTPCIRMDKCDVKDCTYAHTREELKAPLCLYDSYCKKEGCKFLHPSLNETFGIWVNKNGYSNIFFPGEKTTSGCATQTKPSVKNSPVHRTQSECHVVNEKSDIRKKYKEMMARVENEPNSSIPKPTPITSPISQDNRPLEASVLTEKLEQVFTQNPEDFPPMNPNTEKKEEVSTCATEAKTYVDIIKSTLDKTLVQEKAVSKLSWYEQCEEESDIKETDLNAKFLVDGVDRSPRKMENKNQPCCAHSEAVQNSPKQTPLNVSTGNILSTLPNPIPVSNPVPNPVSNPVPIQQSNIVIPPLNIPSPPPSVYLVPVQIPNSSPCSPKSTPSSSRRGSVVSTNDEVVIKLPSNVDNKLVVDMTKMLIKKGIKNIKIEFN